MPDTQTDSLSLAPTEIPETNATPDTGLPTINYQAIEDSIDDLYKLGSKNGWSTTDPDGPDSVRRPYAAAYLPLAGPSTQPTVTMKGQQGLFTDPIQIASWTIQKTNLLERDTNIMSNIIKSAATQKLIQEDGRNSSMAPGAHRVYFRPMARHFRDYNQSQLLANQLLSDENIERILQGGDQPVDAQIGDPSSRQECTEILKSMNYQVHCSPPEDKADIIQRARATSRYYTAHPVQSRENELDESLESCLARAGAKYREVYQEFHDTFGRVP